MPVGLGIMGDGQPLRSGRCGLRLAEQLVEFGLGGGAAPAGLFPGAAVGAGSAVAVSRRAPQRYRITAPAGPKSAGSARGRGGLALVIEYLLDLAFAEVDAAPDKSCRDRHLNLAVACFGM